MKQACWKQRFGIILIAGLLTAGLLAPVMAQTVKQVTINYIEALAAPDHYANQVRIYATVTSEDNAPVSGLSENNFDILEDGVPVDIDEVALATDPMAVVLAIDTSGSMQASDRSGQTSMEAAKNAAIHFVSLLGEDDQIALFSFNNEPALKLEFSKDHQAAVTAVESLAAKPNAATCLYDTAYDAVKKAAEIPRGRRAVILLTDGRDEKAGKTCSTHNSNDVIDIATTKSIRVPIYTIGVGPKIDERELGRISDLTGGRSLFAGSLAEIESFYKIIADQLKNQYLTTYMSRTPSGEHSLVLKVHDDAGRSQDEKRFWSPPLPVSRPMKITFAAPDPGSALKGVVDVKARVEPEETIAKIRYYVDAGLKKEDVTPPFEAFRWDTAGLSGGLHILRIEAVDFTGRTGSAELTVRVDAPPTRPAAPSPPATVEKKPAGTAAPWAAILGLIAVLAGGGVWWFLRRQRQAQTDTCEPYEENIFEKPDMDFEDETIFMADNAKTEPVPPASIKVLQSQCLEAGKTFKVAGSTFIGRSSDNDIHVPDQSVSRKHGEIFFDDGRFHIRDLGSKNGIKVDGKRIRTAGIALRNGSKIQLAPQTILEFNVFTPADEIELDDKTRKYEM